MNLIDEKPSLLFFTTATRHYLPFFPIYVYFAAISNPGAAFEFIVDDAIATEQAYSLPLSFLRDKMRLRVHLREPGNDAPRVAMQNTYRFVVPPESKADFVYIGDVDIMIVDDVWIKHKRVFERGLPYSNRVRHNTTKLTGLHFTRYDTYYPLPEIRDIANEFKNDEEVLYQIVKRSGQLDRQAEIDAVGVGRPVHGIHMSLNRIPFSDPSIRVDWGID